jgi:hypothetical protein
MAQNDQRSQPQLVYRGLVVVAAAAAAHEATSEF